MFYKYKIKVSNVNGGFGIVPVFLDEKDDTEAKVHAIWLDPAPFDFVTPPEKQSLTAEILECNPA